MRSNTSLVEKLKRQRRSTRPVPTARTDNFIATMPALSFDPADFADHNALVRVTVQVREHLIGWAEFARQLERELMQSVPKEWRK